MLVLEAFIINIIDLIEKKRDGKVLSNEEIDFFTKSVSNGTIEDYQTSALLMAMYINGMNSVETSQLTLAMSKSGDWLDLSEIDGVKVDKHSTGGVADTTTLILAPLVASCGVPVVKMSGRGLGFTGGTLDKLESIPNFDIEVSDEDVIKYGKTTQIVVMGQSDNLTPADKKLYALRDVTATVSSIPLIAGSIMSKKIAAGSDAIVLDVKCGSGAFMKNIEEAEELATTMVEIGKHVGRNVIAVITSMQQPLGTYIGNSLEVIEAIETLKGNVIGDLLDVSLELGSHMLVLAGKVNSPDEGKKLLYSKIQNGEGLAKFKELIDQQGGDSRVIDDYSLFDSCKCSHKVVALESGYFYSTDSEGVGRASVQLGAGRYVKTDVLDYGAGLIMKKRVGDKIEKGDVICEMFSSTMEKINLAEKMFMESIKISSTKPEIEPLILKVIS